MINQSYSCVNALELENNAPVYATNFSSISEPASGFTSVLHNVYSHVLETFISVLSSISSHILHSIFYNVIEEVITGKGTVEFSKEKKAQLSDSKRNSKSKDPSPQSHKDLSSNKGQQSKEQQVPSEIQVYACKIAEKIITICQGDLLVSHNLLDALVEQFCNQAPCKPWDQAGQQAQASMKSLWLSLRQKVFPNYSTKGYRLLIEWIQLKMSHLVTSPKTLA